MQINNNIPGCCSECGILDYILAEPKNLLAHPRTHKIPFEEELLFTHLDIVIRMQNMLQIQFCRFTILILKQNVRMQS